MALHIMHLAAVAGIGFCLSIGHATANDKPLIWTPRKDSANHYAMRMGSLVSNRWDARAGAEIAFRGAQPNDRSNPTHPVKFWASVALPASGKGTPEQTRLNLNLNGLEGGRDLSLSHVRVRDLHSGYTARLEQVHTIRHAPRGDGRLHLRASGTIRIDSSRTRTALFASGHRLDTDDHWHASVGLEQRLYGGIRLTAKFDDVAGSARIGRFNAGYSHRW